MPEATSTPSAGTAESGAEQGYRFNPAMTVTYMRFLLGPLFVICYAQGTGVGYVLALAIAIAGMFTDFLDGYLARARGQVTELGKALDPVADVAFFQTVYATMAVCEPHWVPWWAIAMLLTRELIQYAVIRTIALARGTVLAARLTGKLKTALGSGVLVAVLSADVARFTVGVTGPDWATIYEVGGAIGFGSVAVLGLGSLIQYTLVLRGMRADA